MEMAQRGRRDIDQRARLPPHPRLEAAALDNQERPLLVRAEPAMLAEADLALAVRGVLHDRGVAGDAMRVGPVLAGQRDRDAHRRIDRQADPRQTLADKQLADPILAR